MPLIDVITEIIKMLDFSLTECMIVCSSVLLISKHRKKTQCMHAYTDYI